MGAEALPLAGALIILGVISARHRASLSRTIVEMAGSTQQAQPRLERVERLVIAGAVTGLVVGILLAALVVVALTGRV